MMQQRLAFGLAGLVALGLAVSLPVAPALAAPARTAPATISPVARAAHEGVFAAAREATGDRAGAARIQRIKVGNSPIDVAVDDERIRVYLPNSSDGTISVVDAVTEKVVKTITVGGTPGSMVIGAGHRYGYVADAGAGEAAGRIVAIDLETMNVSHQFQVPESSAGLALSPDGSRLYVVAKEAGTVTMVDTASRRPLRAIAVGKDPGFPVLDPLGARLYVPNDGSNTVSIIDTAAERVTKTVKVGDSPGWATISPDGSRVYVTNTNAGTISVIDTARGKAVSTISLGGTTEKELLSPMGIEMSSDGSHLYVSGIYFHDASGDDLNGALWEIDPTTQKVTRVTELPGSAPIGIALSPGGGVAYLADYWGGTLSVVDSTGVPPTR
jgi:YVTN family beta-propeller protein